MFLFAIFFCIQNKKMSKLKITFQVLNWRERKKCKGEKKEDDDADEFQFIRRLFEREENWRLILHFSRMQNRPERTSIQENQVLLAFFFKK